MDLENIDTKLKINEALGKFNQVNHQNRTVERIFSASDGTKKVDERIDQK